MNHQRLAGVAVAISVLLSLPVQTKSLNCLIREVLRSIEDYFPIRAIESYFLIIEDCFLIRANKVFRPGSMLWPLSAGRFGQRAETSMMFCNPATCRACAQCQNWSGETLS